MADKPALTLKILDELIEGGEYSSYDCPARCGDLMWHPFFNRHLVAKAKRLRLSLGRHCIYPSTAEEQATAREDGA